MEEGGGVSNNLEFAAFGFIAGFMLALFIAAAAGIADGGRAGRAVKQAMQEEACAVGAGEMYVGDRGREFRWRVSK